MALVRYLNNQSSQLNNTNSNILNDIQTISVLPMSDPTSRLVSENIDSYSSNLDNSTSALTLLKARSAALNPSDITTFSSNLTTAENNFSQLKYCYDNALVNLPCSSSGAGISSSASTSTSTTTSTSTVPPPPPPNPPAPPLPPAKQQNPYLDPNMLSAAQSGLLTFTGGNREFFSTNSIYGGRTMPIYEGLTEMGNYNAELQLIQDMNEFNKKYERYIKCNDPWNNSDCAANEICIDPTNPNKKITINNCTPLNEINESIGNINSKISKLKGTSNNYNYTGKPLTPDQYENNYQAILNEHEKILKVRNDLDNKIKMLYNPDKSIGADNKKSFDATIYSGILISALATSALFYVFNHLD
jgi:hypothetical protein